MKADGAESGLFEPEAAGKESVMATPPARVAIVGMGKVGHIRYGVIDGHDKLNVVALSDVDESIRDEFPDCDFDVDYENVVTRPDIDVVFVATTNRHAPGVVCKALESGKHVFCEKPPGRSVEDMALIMQTEARNPGLKLQFGFNHRYHYGVMEAKNMVDSGVFGKILWARGVYGKMGGEDFENTWRSDPEQAGGGILLDQGIHMLDLFCHFMGDFDEVKSMVQTMHWNIPLEDNAFAILKTPDNKIAMLHSSATQWKHKFNLELCLEDGYINLTGILSSTRSYGDETLVYARKDLAGKNQSPGNPQEEMIYFDRDHSWALEVDNFIKAVREDKPVKWGNSSDAMRAMCLVDEIYRRGR